MWLDPCRSSFVVSLTLVDAQAPSQLDIPVQFTVRHAIARLAASSCRSLMQNASWSLFAIVRPSFLIVLCLLVPAVSLSGREKPPKENYGMGLIVDVPASEEELVGAVQAVADDGIIEGSKEYNKDQYISGAELAADSPLFSKWTGPGKTFFKIKKNALDPRNFKDTNDTGTLAVRYIVQSRDDKNATLRIDAIFVDDFHHREHLSNGSVEAGEYKDIQDHIASIRLERQKTSDNDKVHQQELARQELQGGRNAKTMETAITMSPGETLSDHVQKLRHALVRVTRAPGAQLKSAPFRSSSSVKALPAGAQVLILINTPYWFGVETESGEHGWIHRSDLEQMP